MEGRARRGRAGKGCEGRGKKGERGLNPGLHDYELRVHAQYVIPSPSIFSIVVSIHGALGKGHELS